MNRVLDPDRMPARDSDGWAYHPDIDNLLVDGDEGAELPIDDAKLGAAGFRAAYVAHDAQTEEPSGQWEEYWGVLGGGSCALWMPEPPDATGWQLVGVYDTDDGPHAMFVQPIEAPGGGA